MLEYAKPVLIEDLGMLYPTETSSSKVRYGLYVCMCGNKFKAQQSRVKHGYTKSCGCFQIKRTSEKNTTHHMTKHSLYSIWSGMITRCTNVNQDSFKYYGGRGINVCDRWQDINNFIEDMYPTWEYGLTIDRINNDGNYEPSNCRWATREYQVRNTRVIRVNNTSGYRGVSPHRKKWVANIGVKGKIVYLGIYEISLDAAMAYDQYIIKNNLEHTRNFNS